MKKVLILTLTFWLLIVGISFLWNMDVARKEQRHVTLQTARTLLTQVILTREWNANHGGVYVPVTADMKPNPYLDDPLRDIQVNKDLQLTKVNPSFMTRQLSEIAAKRQGVQFHLTSLQPIRPQNSPSEWEKKALELFERGEKEVGETLNNHPNTDFIYMVPLIAEKSCLKCHSAQGYKEGDIRGGISISIPMAPHAAIEQANITTSSIIYLFLWTIGVSGTLLGMLFLNRQIQKRLQAEASLLKHEKMTGVMEMAGAVCHELNQPLQVILGNAEIMLMDLEADHPLSKRVQRIQEQVERMSKTTRNLIKITSYETKQFPQGTVIDIDKALKTDKNFNGDPPSDGSGSH